MARESCNLDKDEAEILKHSSSSSPSPTSPAPPSSPQSASPSLFLRSCEESPFERSERLEHPASETATLLTSTPKSIEELMPSLESKSSEESQLPLRFINRCSSCRKRVGLTGFRCRCGDLFCGLHRYSDTHDCSFDYKALGREEIAKANPVIRAAKIIKI